jgi:hypothetical protein
VAHRIRQCAQRPIPSGMTISFRSLANSLIVRLCTSHFIYRKAYIYIYIIYVLQLEEAAKEAEDSDASETTTAVEAKN